MCSTWSYLFLVEVMRQAFKKLECIQCISYMKMDLFALCALIVLAIINQFHVILITRIAVFVNLTLQEGWRG